MISRISLAFLFALFLAVPAAAATVASPSLWHVQGAKGDAYLLGSVHILPPGVQWRSPQIAAAMARADVFVFEVPQDEKSMTQVKTLIAGRAYLPAGQSLRAMLHPAARVQFDEALAASGLPLSAVDHQRPWAAALQMMMAQLARHDFGPDDGIDAKIMAEVAGKEMRYLETIADQIALLAPDDRQLELEEFEAGLPDLRDAAAEIQPLVDAWSAGDQKKLDELVNGDFEGFPAVKKALLDDRNVAWTRQIKAMLDEKHTFFITVGAGHLTGPTGVPALLRAAGFRVEGP